MYLNVGFVVIRDFNAKRTLHPRTYVGLVLIFCGLSKIWVINLLYFTFTNHLVWYRQMAYLAYIVFKGLRPGVYTSWHETHAQVSGYQGVVY